MESKFKIGQRVKINFRKFSKLGTVARIEFCFGYIYIVDIDGIGAKQVNHIMLEAI
jgi:hypothetical protein